MSCQQVAAVVLESVSVIQVKADFGAMGSQAELKGRDLVTGIPKNLEINSEEIRESLMESINTIIETVRITLEGTPPELAADIVDRGITLAGGGALLSGLDILLKEETGLPIKRCPDPLSAVVLGTGKALDSLDLLKKVALQN